MSIPAYPFYHFYHAISGSLLPATQGSNLSLRDIVRATSTCRTFGSTGTSEGQYGSEWWWWNKFPLPTRYEPPTKSNLQPAHKPH